MNPFQGPVNYSLTDFVTDIEAIERMLESGEPARVPEPEPIVVTDDTTGLARQVRINTHTPSYRVCAYFVDKYGEPGLRRHVVYFGVIRYLRGHRRELLRNGRLRREPDGLSVDARLLCDLLARPAETFL